MVGVFYVDVVLLKVEYVSVTSYTEKYAAGFVLNNVISQ